HALALDLHHAGAAIAVGAVAGLGRIAQVRNVDAFALGDLPDGLARLRRHLAAVEREFHRLWCLVHRVTSLPLAAACSPPPCGEGLGVGSCAAVTGIWVAARIASPTAFGD